MSVFGDALRLLSECSPFVSEEIRQRIEKTFDDATNDGLPASWNRTGDVVAVWFPDGDPETPAKYLCPECGEAHDGDDDDF